MLLAHLLDDSDFAAMKPEDLEKVDAIVQREILGNEDVRKALEAAVKNFSKKLKP